MKTINILGVILRSVTIVYILFALIYGILVSSIDLTKTINFNGSITAAATARQKQLFVGVPYIILGVALLALLIVFYVSYRPKTKLLAL